MKKAWVLSYPLSAQRRLWSDWAESSLGVQSFCWFFQDSAHIGSFPKFVIIFVTFWKHYFFLHCYCIVYINVQFFLSFDWNIVTHWLYIGESCPSLGYIWTLASARHLISQLGTVFTDISAITLYIYLGCKPISCYTGSVDSTWRLISIGHMFQSATDNLNEYPSKCPDNQLCSKIVPFIFKEYKIEIYAYSAYNCLYFSIILHFFEKLYCLGFIVNVWYRVLNGQLFSMLTFVLCLTIYYSDIKLDVEKHIVRILLFHILGSKIRLLKVC